MGGSTASRALRRTALGAALVTASQLLAACPGRTAVGVAGTVAGTAIQTTGVVVGGTVKVLTFSETDTAELAR